MTTKKNDSVKSGRDSQGGKFIRKDDAAKNGKHVVVETEKRDKGGTESTGPKKQ